MSLPPPVSRQLRHRRAIVATAYEREDGLWDIDACLTDHKPRDFPLSAGIRPKGLPIHELWLRITIDRRFNVVDAHASSDWVPYAGLCQGANPAYRALIGLNLLQNFRREAGRRLGGTAGCTHLTEMLGVLPTTAIQAFVGVVEFGPELSGAADAGAGKGGPAKDAGKPDAAKQYPGDTEGGGSSAEATPPFQLGRCHALRFDGEAVKQFYPRWYGHAPRSVERGAQSSGRRDDADSVPQGQR